MALVHNPKIVVQNDPEAGLDPQSQVLVDNIICGLFWNRRVVVPQETHAITVQAKTF